jgi:hypothetical protein
LVSAERIARGVPLLLASDITPYLVALHVPNCNVAYGGLEQAFASFASKYQDAEDRVAVSVRQSLNAADTATLDKQLDYRGDALGR